MTSRLVRIMAATLLAAMLAGCGSTLLRARFETEAIGAPPETRPPGPPAGDEVAVWGDGAGARVVPDPAFGHALLYTNDGIDPLLSRLVFTAAEPSGRSEHFWAMWKGKPEQPQDGGSPLLLALGNVHFGMLVQLRLYQGRVWLRTGAGLDDYEPIGNYVPDQAHTVLIHVDKAAARFAVSVLARGASADSGSRDVLFPEYLSAMRPTVYVWFTHRATSLRSHYTVDDMLITESCPIDGDLVTQGACDAM